MDLLILSNATAEIIPDRWDHQIWYHAASKLDTDSVLDIPTLVKVSICIIISTLLARKLLVANFHLQKFRGPWWAAYSRLWLCRTLGSGNSAQIFVDINKRYGPIARIGPNHLITSDPEVTRHILAVNSKWSRGPWFDSIRIDPRVSNIG
jgi:hypothetical protein